jgi:hypothetical protein
MKKTSALCFLLSFLLIFTISSFSQTVTLTATVPTGGGAGYSTNDIVLAAGDTASVLSQINKVSQYDSTTAVEINGVQFLVPNVLALIASPGSGTGSAISQTSGWVFSGPARIRAYAGGSSSDAGKSSLTTINVLRANAVPTITPQNAAVIPADAGGNYNVILESSTDLITWTAATPGTYSSTTQKRFFRTRIVKL